MVGLKSNEAILYAIAVYGYAPEFWPAVAFRKQKQDKVEKVKEIKCPYCGKLLLTVSASRKLELRRYTNRVNVGCHEYRKCKACYEKIGIIFIAG